MGQGLKGRRDKVFLMTKVCTHGRDKKVAMQQLEESLKRLRTDHLDLWQIHECVYDNDPERHFAKGGVVEALDEAKKAGKVALRRLHRPQDSGHPSQDAVVRLPVRQRADAAQRVRRHVPQLPDARAARGATSGAWRRWA